MTKSIDFVWFDLFQLPSTFFLSPIRHGVCWYLFVRRGRVWFDPCFLTAPEGSIKVLYIWQYQRLSAIECCLPLKAPKSSSVKECLPLKDVFYQRSSSILSRIVQQPYHYSLAQAWPEFAGVGVEAETIVISVESSQLRLNLQELGLAYHLSSLGCGWWGWAVQ